MEKQNDKQYPSFISNETCNEDLFEGKSHENTAKAISNIIVNNNDCRVIGIDGGWGSGKSNLVCLIEREIAKISQSNNYRFFTYDAWGHQEDLQRRSILEELIEDLTSNKLDGKLILPNSWNGKLDELLAKKSKKTTETVPKLGAGFIVSILVVITTPIFHTASSWLSEGCVWGKFILTILPLIIGVVYLYSTAINNFKNRGVKFSFFKAIEEMFLLYKDEVKSNTTYENISEKEPSSREFKQWVHNIDKDLNENVLVLVFDNLDRLPKHKVQELWATIHTFFADEKYKNIKVIVPFDRAHIVSAFKEQDTINCNTEGEKESNKVLEISYGDDYINKTFDIIYRVSPPTMSNWKDYFTLKWSDAFGVDVTPSSYILQIFDCYTNLLTPRKIIAFINEFVAVKQMPYSLSIDDKYVALFIFGKSKISKHPDNEIIEPTFIKESIKYIFENNDDLAKNISALYYQLEPNVAQDIILVQNLKRSLENNDIEHIEKISKLKLFKHILDKVIPSVSNISNAIISLENNTCCDRSNWDYLYNMLKNKKNDETTHDRLQKYQTILLRNITNRDEYLRTIIYDFYTDNNSVEDAISFSDDIKQLSSIVEDDTPYSILKDVYVEPANFIDFVKKTKTSWRKFKVGCDTAQFTQYVSLFDLKGIEHFDIAKYIKDDFDLANEYKNTINSLIDVNVNNLEALSILYSRLKEVEKVVSKILSDAQMHSLKSSMSGSDSYYCDLLCMRISRFSKMNAAHAVNFEADLNSTEDVLVEKIANNIEYYVSYSDLLLNTATFKKPLYLAVVKWITEQQKGSSLVIETVLPKYDVIKSDLGVDATIFINNLNRLNEPGTKHFSVLNITSIPLELFRDIIDNELNNNLSNYCIEIAIEYLISKNKEGWKDSIQDCDYDLSILGIIKPNMPQHCFDAMQELLYDYAKGDISALDKGKLDMLMELSIKSDYEPYNTFKTIRDIFIDKVNMNIEYFEFFGEWLFKFGELDKKSEVLRTIFVSEVIESKTCISLMSQYVVHMKQVVKNAKSESNDFKKKIQSMLNGNVDYDIEMFEEFASSLGIKKEVVEPKNVNE